MPAIFIFWIGFSSLFCSVNAFNESRYLKQIGVFQHNGNTQLIWVKGGK